MANRDILRCDDLLIGYRHPICRKINLTLKEGQLVLFKGDNGAGKSTLVKTLTGEIPPLGGKFQWMMEKESISLLPQVIDVYSFFSYTAEEILDFYDVDEEYRVFFPDFFKKKKLGEMSGGEKQKVFIVSRFKPQHQGVDSG